MHIYKDWKKTWLKENIDPVRWWDCGLFLFWNADFLIYFFNNVHKYKHDQNIKENLIFLIFNIVPSSSFTMLPMTIQIALMSLIHVSLIIAPLGQSFTLWKLRGLGFCFFFLF